MSSNDIKSLLAASMTNPEAAPAGESSPKPTPHPMTIGENWEQYKSMVLPKTKKHSPFVKDMTPEQEAKFYEVMESVWYSSAGTVIAILYQIGQNASSDEEGSVIVSRLAQEVSDWQGQLLHKVFVAVAEAMRRRMQDGEGN